MATKSRIFARVQRHSQLARLLRACAALVERRQANEPIDPLAMRALRSAALRFVDEVDPDVRKALYLTAQPYEDRPEQVRKLAAQAYEAATFVRQFKGRLDLKGRSRSPTEAVAEQLVQLAHDLGLVAHGLGVNERALTRLHKALENKQFRTPLKLAKLVLEAAGVPARNALDWTKLKRKSK
jgi:hypothetical protein